MEKAKLFKKLTDRKVQCLACQRYCEILPDNVGFCPSRLNRDGILYSLNYGILNGIQIDPIEKKPLYHFYPGTQVLSFGSLGCNFRCKQCLNWHCSWGEPAEKILEKLKVPACGSGNSTRLIQPCSKPDPSADRKNLKIIKPKEIINLAIKNNCPGIAFTYNEPSIWPEFVYDTAKLAKENGLYTVFVTNGSWTKESLDYLGKYIDACNIDIKGFYPQTYKKMGAFFGEILKITELVVRKYHIFTELTTLVIPTINDSEKELTAIALWIKSKLGSEIPWHLSRFDPLLAPDLSFQKLPDTSIKTLNKAYQIGKFAGLKYVYVWAPPKKQDEDLYALGDTLCPHCGKRLVKRFAWQPKINGLAKKGKQVICRFCHNKLYFKF